MKNIQFRLKAKNSSQEMVSETEPCDAHFYLSVKWA